jgi:hypothetical protein
VHDTSLRAARRAVGHMRFQAGHAYAALGLESAESLETVRKQPPSSSFLSIGVFDPLAMRFRGIYR